MTSDKQIDANQTTARESKDELDALIIDFDREYHPFGAVERGLLFTMIKSEWRYRRCRSAADAIRNRPLACHDDASLDASLREALIRQKEALARIRQCLNSTARDFDKAFNSLTALQAKRSFCSPFEPIQPKSRRRHLRKPSKTESPGRSDIATKPLNPKMVSFLHFSDSPDKLDPKPPTPTDPEDQKPPIAG